MCLIYPNKQVDMIILLDSIAVIVFNIHNMIIVVKRVADD